MIKYLYLFALLASGDVLCQTYKWYDDRGGIHYSDKPPPTGTQSKTLRVSPQESSPAAETLHTNKPKLDDVNAVPYLDDFGRRSYLEFLSKPLPRAFVLCKDGRHSTFSAASEEEVETEIRKVIQFNKRNACRTYARNETVVW